MFIKPNEGRLDRAIRASIGITALALALFYLTGLPQIIAFTIALIGIGTGIIGYCGLYTLLGINTCPTNSKKS